MSRPWLAFAWRSLFGFSVLAAAILYGGIGELRAAAATLDPSWFWGALALSLAGTIVIPALITRHNMAVAAVRLRIGELLRINLVMRFYVLLLPHAVTVGMRWMRYRIGQEGKGWQLAALIAFERTVQLLVVTATSAVLLIVADRVPPSLKVLILPAAAMSLLLMLIALLFVSRTILASFRPLLDWLTARVPQPLAQRIGRMIQAVSDYQSLGRRGVLRVLALAVLGHLLFIGSGYAVSVGLGLPFTFVEIGWMRSVVYLVTLLPLTVGGIGVREASFATLFVLHGIERPVAVAYPLILLAIQLLIGLFGAVLELAQLLRGRDKAQCST